jgi:predicted  nucleic acid-binding Zn-ribbon protein
MLERRGFMKKLTIEEVRKRAKGIGIWEVLDDVYMGAHVKLKCKCLKCGYQREICGRDLQKNKRCSMCFKKLKIDKLKIRAKKLGKWEILDDTYQDAYTKLKCRCVKCGYIYKIGWNKIQQNSGCPKCSKMLKLTIEEVKKRVRKLGIWEVIDNNYKNGKTKLLCKCVKAGHINEVTWRNLQRNSGCPRCNALTIEKIKSFTEEHGVWIVLDEYYKDAHSKLRCKCVKSGHFHMISWHHIYQGGGCPFCNDGVSKWEKAVKNFLTESNVKYIPNDRTQLLNPITNYNFELDIWMPKLNKAIECNGVYWHKRKKQNDKIKEQLCKDQNIDLLVITDEEWNKDTDKCKIKIKNFVAGE